MYGIVNQAIQGLIEENYGQQVWEEIKHKSGVDVPFFLSDHPYDDEITYSLVGSSSEVLNLSAEQVLRAFGEYWVLKTGQEKYGQLMKAGGADFVEFIKNLPTFHSRIMLLYPKLSPPEFSVETLSDKQISLHYYSTRSGLTYFVIGLIEGIGKMFETNMRITHTATDQMEVWHDTFLIEILD